MPESSPTPGSPGEPFDVEQFARETISSIEATDEYADALELRVTRIEEIIAARWPRSTVLRWRLARELRASAASLRMADLEGADFVTRRTEAAGLEVELDAQRRRRLHEGGQP